MLENYPEFDSGECNPGDSYCRDKCRDFTICEDMKEAHRDNKCWPGCPECEKEERDERNMS